MKIQQFSTGVTIGGWKDYKIIFDKAMIASLKNDTPFVHAASVRALPCSRSIFSEVAYQGFIPVPSVNVLFWSSGALISFVALLGMIAYWIVR